MHITLAFNQLVAEEDDQPPSRCSLKNPAQPDDRYAEWDDENTILAVADALRLQHQVSLVNADLDFFESVRRLKPDLVFNMTEGLHGGSREAQVPTMLEMLQIPYTGSDPLTLGLCLDKYRTKEILSYRQLPTPGFALIDQLSELPEHLHYPLLVKPPLEGSSKGITNSSLVREPLELMQELARIRTTYGQKSLVEEFLSGREFTVAMLGNGPDLQILPLVEIDFSTLPAGANPIYSYEAKWLWDTEAAPLQIFHCPAPLEPLLKRNIEDLCRKAFHHLGCRDWCRIDLRLDSDGHPQIIEVNPLPGVLPRPEQNSCFPKAARAAGLSYQQMILSVVDAACVRLGLVEKEHARRSLL
ncbi:MAG: ATP-grasp domain-containing protein [Deltaproteobacteria bacterium]|nr:ATP-grasp domain-containing protein [Deltaproteobacteria bacterium]